jgi:hypothetical protein
VDQTALTNLAVLLGLGAGFIAPTKAAVDVVKRAAPDLPPWALLAAALVIGEAIVTLVAVYGGLDPTPAHLAGVVLGGAVAAGGAVASTELHRAARAPTAVTVESVADELEARMREQPAPSAEPDALVTQPPHWLPPAPTTSTPAPAADPADHIVGLIDRAEQGRG